MLLYALTILVSAFLLFQVQPVIAKIILPWFGGSAAVWTTCLLFFQLVLLLGYLYSHALVRYLKPRAQMMVHGALLLASAMALPIYPSVAWKPVTPNDPILRILGLLAAAVGLPYFVLSTTGPLLQAWYARRRQGAMPYRLYALSNAGSMFALLSYPVLFEPVFTTRQQAVIWSIAYGAFILLCGLTAFRSGTAERRSGGRSRGPRQRPRRELYAMWLLLPACASALLLAVTSHLSQNVAPIPLLWVLPLSVYLFSFILCFERAGWYRRNPYIELLGVALAGMAYAMFSKNARRPADQSRDSPVSHGPLHLLDGVPRGVGAPETASPLLDALLPDRLGRRRGGRVAGRDWPRRCYSTLTTSCRSGWWPPRPWPLRLCGRIRTRPGSATCFLPRVTCSPWRHSPPPGTPHIPGRTRSSASGARRGRVVSKGLGGAGRSLTAGSCSESC